MELNDIFPKPIEDLCDEILSGDSFIRIISNKFNADRNFLEDNYQGHVSEEKLKEIISMSAKNPKVRDLLTAIVDCVSDDSITNDIFDMLYSYRYRRVRQDLIVSLCHKRLPVNMLKMLCSTNLCFECYFELAIRIYQSDEYTAADLKNTLRLFLKSPFSSMKDELICEIKAANSSSYDKQEIVDNFEFTDSLF